MSFTDPIGDMLTRIRNASSARHEKVLVPKSRLKVRIAEVLRDEGFIKDFVVHQDGVQGAITIVLKYSADREPAISDIKRVSKPGLRRYVPTDSIPRVLNGMGIAILSTSKGVLVDREARKQKVGGELICTVW
ncbi:30S ribosomal protein S8 [Anaeromyxobacter oryzae]|uniref:Small ribosomal subunit protein uS8 n=1 Tax=Anaeromyxobacter oryzae TaxID=2918170 RepID=A0ABN6N0Q2_9BACT|nr:30S ribosomal protein S8 [Anaeromyxobacter oryzae]BDG06758.1 30S ribosomal protein S8 [Anaeromyxobacter oryzae]